MYPSKLGILKAISDFYSANRKRADARKTGGGPPPPRFTEVEELAVSQTAGRPVAEGIPGGTSSLDRVTQDPTLPGGLMINLALNLRDTKRMNE